MTTTLRDLVFGERDALDALIAMDEGELTTTAEQLWAELEGAIDEKIERWALWTKRQDALAATIKGEVERLVSRRMAILNAIERSKAELQRQMEAAGKSKVNGVLVTVAVQNNPPKIVGELTPEALSALRWAPFVRCVPASLSLDRKAAMDYAKDGGVLPPELAIENGTHLRIR